MSRIKPVSNSPVFHNFDEINAALAMLAALRRDVAAIEAEMNESIDAAKRTALEKSAFYRAEIAGLESGLLRFAGENRAEIMAKGRSCRLAHGVIGWRLSSRLKTLPKWTWERVLAKLLDEGAAGLVRVKREADREAMRSLPPARLRELGCRVVQEDVFYYELAEEEIGGAS